MRMKFTRSTLFLLIWMVSCVDSIVAQTPPFTQGVNLSTWFQAESAQAIPFTKFTKKDFENIQSLGCDVIRIPINLHAMTNGAPDYVPDPLFLFFFDEILNWAEALEIYVILDNHSSTGVGATDPNVGIILNKVWAQIATHFKDRSEFLMYEVLNEPNGIDNMLWGNIQGEAILSLIHI